MWAVINCFLSVGAVGLFPQIHHAHLSYAILLKPEFGCNPSLCYLDVNCKGTSHSGSFYNNCQSKNHNIKYESFI